MTEPKGLLDTSVVIDHDLIDHALLPDESAISAVSLAELAAGPHATQDTDERARRQDRLQWASSTWEPLPFDIEAARAYGRMFAAARAAGQTSRTRLAWLAHCFYRRSKQLTPLHAEPFRLWRPEVNHQIDSHLAFLVWPQRSHKAVSSPLLTRSWLR